MRLANTEYSAWDFERKGSFDMDAYEEPVLCADSIVVPYIHAVKRGKWLPEAVAANAENRLDIDYGKRAKQSRYDIFRQKVIDGIWQMCPRLIVSLQNKLGR